MAEDGTIKIAVSVKLKEYVAENFKDSNDAPEAIKALLNQESPVRKRGGKADLCLAAEQPSPAPLITVSDILWLKTHMKKLDKDGQTSTELYLHHLLEGCNIVLPEPPVIERNPELEARVQRLRKEQEAREYKAMTKNVDNVRVKHPDDSLAFQMKMVNSHLIAVLQFVVSVAAGFTFGFLGIELMVGSLEFGFRLLLGVACALTIALAEIYFLAKKLSEDYEDEPPLQYLPVNKPLSAPKSKMHSD